MTIATMIRGLKLADAKREIFVNVIGKDCDGAVRNDNENCIIARSGKRIHHFEWVCVMRNTFYARRRGSRTAKRWFIDSAGLSLVRQFDKTGRLPPAGLILRLVPPKGVRTLEYLRSNEFREKRITSAQSRKGKPRRDYRHDPLPEVRWGAGS